MNSSTLLSNELQLELDMNFGPLNNFEWTDRDVLALHDSYLTDQLQLLNDERTSRETRIRILSWVATSIVPIKEAFQYPLSFQLCCYAAGVDPEEMQLQVFRIFKPLLADCLESL